MLAALGGIVVSTAPGAALAQNVPSYGTPAARQEVIHGTVTGFDGAYTVYMRDDRGYNDSVTMHQGTIINPTGIRLVEGMRVSIWGYADGPTFDAYQIEVAGGGPYYAGYYGYPYPYYGYAYPYYPAVSIGIGLGWGWGWGGPWGWGIYRPWGWGWGLGWYHGPYGWYRGPYGWWNHGYGWYRGPGGWYRGPGGWYRGPGGFRRPSTAPPPRGGAGGFRSPSTAGFHGAAGGFHGGGGHGGRP
jgi:hypothetical protein